MNFGLIILYVLFLCTILDQNRKSSAEIFHSTILSIYISKKFRGLIADVRGIIMLKWMSREMLSDWHSSNKTNLNILHLASVICKSEFLPRQGSGEIRLLRTPFIFYSMKLSNQWLLFFDLLPNLRRDWSFPCSKILSEEEIIP